MSDTDTDTTVSLDDEMEGPPPFYSCDALAQDANQLLHELEHLAKVQRDSSDLPEVVCAMESLAETAAAVKTATGMVQLIIDGIVNAEGGEVVLPEHLRFWTEKDKKWVVRHEEVRSAAIAKLALDKTTGETRDRASLQAGFDAALALYVSPSTSVKSTVLDKEFDTEIWDVADRVTTGTKVKYERLDGGDDG